MPNSIERDVYVLRDTLKNPISYVRGTDLLPIILHFRDFTIPSTADARVFVAKPDGNAVYGNAAINGNDVTVSIQQQMFLVLGTTLMQLEILDGNETLLTFSQPVIVEPNLKARDFPESITEIKFLDDAIEQAQEAANNASKAVENANNAIETANAAISSANNAAQNANNTAQELLDRAEQGEFDGPQGPSGTITVGTVKTVQPEQNAAVKNIGTPNNAVFDFEIPRGADGMTDLVARYEDASEYTATPTSDAPIVINDLNGKTKQTQTNGYQLFDASKLPSKSENSVDVINNGDGSFTIGGQDTSSGHFIISYVLSHEETIKLLKVGTIKINQELRKYPYYGITASYNSTGQGLFEINSVQSDRKSIEITQEMLDNPEFRIRYFIYANSGQSISKRTIKPMLYQDGDGTWEPFTDGVASPSPDWEQRIAGVGDMGYFDGNLQKGYYNTSGIYTSADNYVCTVNKIECKQSDNINVELETTATSIIVSFFQSSGTFISQQTASGKSITAAAPANAEYCMISINRASIEPQTAGHICVKVNGKYASEVESNGKNLIDMSDAKGGTDNGITVTINKDGSYDYVGTAISNITVNVWLKGGYNLDPNDKKNQLIILKPGKYTCKDVVLYQNINRINSSDSRFNKFNIEKETIITGIRATYAEIGKAYNERCYPILVEGEVSEEELTWQPYRHTSIQFPLTNPLYDGDKICYVKPGESYIDENGDTVVADKMLYGHYHDNIKAIFDGSEDEEWNTNNEKNEFYQFSIRLKVYAKSKSDIDTGGIFSNFGITKDVGIATKEGVWIYNENIFAIVINKTRVEYNANSLKSWLSTHNIEVVYKLAQPWFEPFEDQTPFYNLRSFDNLTYIYSDDPLNPILTVDVAKNQTGGYLLESYAQAQKNAIAEANSQSRLSAIEQQLVNQATAPTE